MPGLSARPGLAGIMLLMVVVVSRRKNYDVDEGAIAMTRGAFRTFRDAG